ncbi:magnesium transporter [Xylanimonas ulmi]|uniref:Magnesium transporter MgtE n=1 Tax=Xylanimonas ulmi TaxID=228973 RepID=A0A4Q7M7D2_9MICO|nr:magnesium transporter [Xylanibacterium ulmi]RZS62562.1 magnesium transporter [Xylanibacterium ulmi]
MPQPVTHAQAATSQHRSNRESLRALVEHGDFAAAQEWLGAHQVWEIVDAIDRMGPVDAVAAFRLLDSDRAFAVFEDLEPSGQQAILEVMRGAEFSAFVDSLDPDDRARMLGELPAKVARRVLEGLSPAERAMTATLLGYPEHSAGRFMTPQVVVLREGLSVAAALARVRDRGADAETVYTLPVVDSQRRLTGVVELSELLLSDDAATVSDLVVTQPPRVRATEPAEAAARLMADSNVRDLPVVDAEDRLLGLLTFDDADEVIEDAETEDAARQGGARRWEGHYMAVSVLQLARTRAVWLVLLLAVSLLTVTVAHAFEEALEQVAALALFIPLLIGTGGKVGTQASSACVRALAIGEVRPSDLARVTMREAATGLLLGAGLGLLAIGAGLWFTGLDVAVVVGVSLLLICLLGALVGGLSPLVARRLGIDPALVSAPVVTTVVDVLGLVIYFLVASMMLGL